MAKPKTFDNKDVSYNKGKAYNLSKSQLKKAGAAKAAKARTVDISGTRRETTGANKGKTLGPGGKPLTGSVRLPSGVMAVYKDGKRVTVSRAKPAKPASSSGSSGSTRRTTTVTTPTKPPAKPPVKPPKANPPKGKPGTVKMGNVYTTTTQTDPQSKAKAAAKSRAQSAARSSGQVPSATRSYANGAASSRPRSNGSPAAKVRDLVAGLSVQGPVDAVKSAAAGANKKKK